MKHRIQTDMASATFGSSGEAIKITLDPSITATVREGHLWRWGIGVPANGSTGWVKGCFYIDTNGASASTILYFNTGDTDSSTWTALTIS